MATLKKSQIVAPVLPRETVEVPELGGEVVVRGLMFSEHMAMLASAASGSGKAFADIPALLAQVVVDAENVPVFSSEEWEQFGAVHFEALIALFKVARRLSGFDAEATEKN